MSDIPITYGHDDTLPPVGYMVERDGKHILIFNPKSMPITVDQINNINGHLFPSYIVTKEKDGIVLECELIEFGVMPKPNNAV